MKTIIILTVLLTLSAGPVFAKSKTLTWDAPVKNEDGTDLTDLAGYKVYDNGANPVDVGNVTTYTFDASEGIHNYTVRAYDTSGNESVDSNVHVYELSICPAAPTNLR